MPSKRAGRLRERELGRRGGIRMPGCSGSLAGQEVRILTFRLEPWNVIDGKIHFEDGEPANGDPSSVPQAVLSRTDAVPAVRFGAQQRPRGIPDRGLSPGAYHHRRHLQQTGQARNPEDNPNEVAETK